MTYKFRYIRVSLLMPVVVFLATMIISSCGGSKSRQEQSESEFSRLRDEGLRALNMGNFDMADSFGDSLLDLGQADPKLTDASIYGNILKGQASIFKDSISPAYSYLHDAEALCLRYDNNFALASVYNGLGIYSENIEKDNNEALRYFFLGLDAAKKSDNARLHSLLLSNIVSIYYLTENPMGLRYALECYDHGKKTHDEFLHYIGSLSTAYSHMIRKEYEPALKFIREAEMVLRTNNINNGATLYCLYGMILRRTGNEEEATDAFLQSIKYMKEPDATDFDLRSYIELAETLREKKRIGEAIEVLEDGLKISDTGYNTIFRGDFLEVLSHTYRLAGNTAKADKYDKIRESEQTSVENRDNEIAIEHTR